MSKIVAYVRVSTGKQERAGNGLEAQRAAIETFARANGFEIDAEPFVEVESGRATATMLSTVAPF